MHASDTVHRGEKSEKLDQLKYLIPFFVVRDCAKYTGCIPSLTFNSYGLENIICCPFLYELIQGDKNMANDFKDGFC